MTREYMKYKITQGISHIIYMYVGTFHDVKSHHLQSFKLLLINR